MTPLALRTNGAITDPTSVEAVLLLRPGTTLKTYRLSPLFEIVPHAARLINGASCLASR